MSFGRSEASGGSGKFTKTCETEVLGTRCLPKDVDAFGDIFGEVSYEETRCQRNDSCNW